MPKEQKTFYLGVEGGATKSTALLVDENDRVIQKSKNGALSYHALGKKRAKDNLRGLLAPLFKKKVKGTLSVVFGLAGLNSERDEKVYKKIIREVLPAGTPFQVVNDMKIALEAECPNEKRKIIVISGTGSTVYGENGKRSAKSIGWGYLFGDEGSSYRVGFKILKAAMQSYDGRIPKTRLEKLVLKRMNSKAMDSASSKAYNIINRGRISMKTYVASFSPLLDEAIERKDRAALEIRRETALELVQGVIAVGDKLQLRKESFCLGYMGSGWKIPGLRSQFEREIKKRFPKVRFSRLEVYGVWGAIILAKQLK